MEAIKIYTQQGQFQPRVMKISAWAEVPPVQNLRENTSLHLPANSTEMPLLQTLAQH